MQKIVVEKKRYVDSVSLMGVSSRVAAVKGVTHADAMMATPANRALLSEQGYVLPEDITANDLVIAVTAERKESLEAAVELARNSIDRKNVADRIRYNTLSEINMGDRPYDLCQISLPGEYAAKEAEKALEMGMDVFIFSDNVTLEEELRLKQLGSRLGRLVMGPDAGVALIGGVALAAGSIIRKGPVGIVAASGSGAQEVGCIIEKCGLGLSSLIGTGGRDLYPEIGGITMLEGIRRMEKDPETKVIVLVSKLADLGVMDRVLTAADTCDKPVAAVFLGSDERLFTGHKVHGTFSLEACALKAVELAGGSVEKFGLNDTQIRALAQEAAAGLEPGRRYFRGLYCGGTFTEEALQYFSANNGKVQLYSNLSNRYSSRLPDSEQSIGNAILDLGAEDFTARAPHPVFDPSLRLERLRRELEDEEVGVILLDFITGPGVAEDPITPFAGECAKHREIRFISSICGSEEDPQNVAEKAELLRDAGVMVMESNYQSAKLASEIMKILNK